MRKSIILIETERRRDIVIFKERKLHRLFPITTHFGKCSKATKQVTDPRRQNDKVETDKKNRGRKD